MTPELVDDTVVLPPVDETATQVITPVSLVKTGPGHTHRKKGRTRWGRARRVVGVGLLLVLFVVGYSIGGALSRPGTDSTAARLAEWARDHHLGPVVTEAEKLQYSLNKPKVGGTVAGGIPQTGSTAAPSASSAPVVQLGSPQPADVPVVAQPPLAGEGQWQTLREVKGLPALKVAYVRPDSVHTSVLSAIAWLDPKLLAFDQRPGTQDPGGSFPGHASQVDPADASVVAAFNSGFRLGKDSRGGWYLDGDTVQPLRDGAASFVTYRDGSAKIGAWNQGVSMTPDVVGVRQNLDLLVHEGKPDASVGENNTAKWGYTLGNVSFVNRSGIGIRSDGTIVYVAGKDLSVATLADLLVRAGAVSGMSLDINPEWTIFTYFTPNAGGPDTVAKLAPSMQKGADAYTQPSTRDFFAVTAKQ